VSKAIATITPTSPLHNLSTGDLADQLGASTAEIADLETREKALRIELIRRGVPDAEGVLFRATVSEAVRWSLNTKAVKAELGATWYDAYCRQSLVTVVAVKARTSIAKLAA
jgi:hypothetical protein